MNNSPAIKVLKAFSRIFQTEAEEELSYGCQMKSPFITHLPNIFIETLSLSKRDTLTASLILNSVAIDNYIGVVCMPFDADNIAVFHKESLKCAFDKDLHTDVMDAVICTVPQFTEICGQFFDRSVPFISYYNNLIG